MFDLPVTGAPRGRVLKLTLVLSGYAIALIAALAVCWVRELAFQRNHVDTSGGMYAWGDLITFSIVFGPLALVATGAALFFLRRAGKFWSLLSIAALPLALTGLAGLILNAFFTAQNMQHGWRDLALVGILRIYPAPVFLFIFLFCCFFAPAGKYRRLMLAAAAIEIPAAATSFYFIAGPFVRLFWLRLFG